MHRAAKEKDKLARSGNYGNIGINPNPGPSRNKSGDAGMTVGHMLRSALTGGMHKEGYRELEVLEENHITYDRDHLVVPWDFLSEYGPPCSEDRPCAFKLGAQRNPSRLC